MLQAAKGAELAELANARGGKTGPFIINEQRSSTDFSDDEKFDTAFDDSKIRSKFVFKVYTILTIQLAFTTIFTIPFLMVDEVQEFATDYPWVIFIFLVGFIVPYFMLVCCESTRRNFPTNIILLFLMTLGMAGVCGYSTARLDTEVVFYAFLLTVIVTVVITIMAIVCPFDFTSCTMVLCVMFAVVVVFSIVAGIIKMFTKSNTINIIYAGVCVILFSLFLIFDTQAIIGGRRVSLSPEEYILGAVQVYVDVIEIFLNFLELIGACTEND